jgi:hypothetical protein
MTTLAVEATYGFDQGLGDDRGFVVWWALLIAQTQLTLILYVILFATAIRLCRSHGEVARPFRIPGGLPGLYAVCGVGTVCCSLVVALGFVPPEELHVSVPGYVAGMIAAVGGVIALPFVIGMFRRPGWLTTPPAVEGEQA